MSARITFCGGAGAVTGANFLFDTNDKKMLIDCGARERDHVCDPTNFEQFAYDPASIDTLIVTHAHADHIGRIPKLVHEGFKGTILSTGATRDIAALMFADSINVMNQDAELHGCDILFDTDDVEHTMALWQTHEYHEVFEIGDTAVEFLDAGHILGSAMIKCTRGGRTMLFTGDLGNSPEPILYDTESPAGANYILMESVYGDKMHDTYDHALEALRAAVEETHRKNGVLLIPSFSIERTQMLIYELNIMIKEGKLAPIHVYLDAPLATRVTEVYRSHPTLLKPDVQKYFSEKGDPFTFPNLTVVGDTKESHAIHGTANPKVIIAGAGMSAGGRIREHEKNYLGDSNTTVLFVGYQAPGSLGRRIQDGETNIHIGTEKIHVRARIASIDGFSGHKDRDHLIEFVEQTGDSLEKVFVTMGEPKSSLFLAQRLHDFLGVEAIVPEIGQSAEIDF